MKTSSDIPDTRLATCPACGLLCDDIEVTTPTVKVKNGCGKSIAFFEQKLSSTSPMVAGKSASLETAVKAAAEILRASKAPLFAGLGTEVQGMRSLVRLAEKTGAIMDHMHSEATVRNTLALQNSGWQTTTLTEVKNRADLIIVVGTDIVTSHPRFFDRLVNNADSLFKQTQPEVIYLCKDAPHTAPDILNALNALVNGKTLHAETVAGISAASLNKVLAKVKAAQYTVIVWSPSKFDFPHAELSVQSITRLIAKLNETSRVAGLPLNTGDGDTSVNNTSTWMTGFATRNRLTKGHFEYDPGSFSSKQQLEQCDALLWTSTFNAYPAPKTQGLKNTPPTIVIGHPDTPFDQQPAVFIPVGIPGLDHTGTMFRLDSAVALPLKKVRNTELPTLSTVIQQIESLLT